MTPKTTLRPVLVLLLAIAPVCIAFVLVQCLGWFREPQDLRERFIGLRPGMSQEEVRYALGRNPDRAFAQMFSITDIWIEPRRSVIVAYSGGGMAHDARLVMIDANAPDHLLKVLTAMDGELVELRK